ncbi:chromate efflux transporter [Domibacillus sp. PGB-M46]|uniref:chromate efflux transporter n=1 Tax=Domibacillus sp. PGB-M46 TaxID=2910255 RepID=UPI001F57267B|nr:chromate efflux transporter [Domibacillus sp. PGB-M46]MCI2255687.1 chromate efflux transporter [Domibacillus sp. PGB-M46]
MRKRNAKTLWEILVVSTRLGLTSFGGPTAHLGYFHEEYVRRRKWIDEQSYADLVALCQFIPGPASSQVGIGIGAARGGVIGGLLAFLGFTLPSVIALILFALLLQGGNIAEAGWIHGLKLVAVAVVAHAILGMAEKLAPDLKRKAIVLAALAVVLLWQAVFVQVLTIAAAALIGFFLYPKHNSNTARPFIFPISRAFGIACLVLFFALLFCLPLLRQATGLDWLALFDSFYRSGALVFGGGHVVLPLLEREFVPAGWLTAEQFLAGYGAAQAVPGPLFTFAAYMGAVIDGWKGGLLATAAIFLPAFLLVFGILPFWDELRRKPAVQGALMGVNAAVIGLLIAAFYMPIWTSSINRPLDFVLAAVLFSLLAHWKLPAWMVVIIGALAGILLDAFL